MGKDRTRHARKGQPMPAPYTEGAPGTVRGRAGTAGTFGENVARRDRDPDEAPARGPDAELRVPTPEQEAAEEENEGVGLSGSGAGASGSLPGSVGGTTGTGGENAGISTPGAAVPDFPGISPGEAERLRRNRR